MVIYRVSLRVCLKLSIQNTIMIIASSLLVLPNERESHTPYIKGSF